MRAAGLNAEVRAHSRRELRGRHTGPRHSCHPSRLCAPPFLDSSTHECFGFWYLLARSGPGHRLSISPPLHPTHPPFHSFYLSESGNWMVSALPSFPPPPALPPSALQADAEAAAPEALEAVHAPPPAANAAAGGGGGGGGGAGGGAARDGAHLAGKKRAVPRAAAGKKWEDPTLTEWPESE